MKVRLLVESLVTVLEGTGKWFLSGVDSEMGLQVEVQRKLFPAELARIRFLPLLYKVVEWYTMDQHVPFQFCIIKEFL